ncbi:hypothetical protein AAVH_39802 [Aphelenchoides avenae]|nr:hypothetical protein AAVH_39802 [Aphelenchus avenae]
MLDTNPALRSSDILVDILLFLPRLSIDNFHCLSRCFRRTIEQRQALLPRRIIEQLQMKKVRRVDSLFLKTFCVTCFTIDENKSVTEIPITSYNKRQAICDFLNVLRSSCMVKRCHLYIRLSVDDVIFIKQNIEEIAVNPPHCRVGTAEVGHFVDEARKWTDMLAPISDDDRSVGYTSARQKTVVIGRAAITHFSIRRALRAVTDKYFTN